MPELDQRTIWIIVAVVVAVLAVLILLALRRRADRMRRRTELRERFGPEYDRAVRDSGSERQAMEDLSQRHERRQRLQLSSLDDATRERISAQMATLQYRFVDQPAEALLDSQRLVTEVLRTLGYPVVTDRAEGLRMLSVDHPLQTQPLRALLQGEYGQDLSDQRNLFLDVRMALRDIAGITYETDDRAGAGGSALPGTGWQLDGQLRAPEVAAEPPAAQPEARPPAETAEPPPQPNPT